jgi:hypothetical protein
MRRCEQTLSCRVSDVLSSLVAWSHVFAQEVGCGVSIKLAAVVREQQEQVWVVFADVIHRLCIRQASWVWLGEPPL